MTGRLGLHGGGEFLPGDEAFLAALLSAAALAAGARKLRICVVPTAAARGRPALAGANGVAALTRAAAALGVPVAVAEVVPVLDAASAADPDLSARLAAADLIHLPGGDPDLLPALYPESAAWTAISSALSRDAVVAGASAGAMALAEWTWTPGGLVRGLGLVGGVVVVPHADPDSWRANLRRFGAVVPPGLGLLGLPERTGILGPLGDDGRATGPWEVVGEGDVRWLPPGVVDAEAARVWPAGTTVRADFLAPEG